MLRSLHALIVAMLAFPAPMLVAVRGQCLGGGLEVALAGSLIFAAPDAQLGQPEMKLGVFAPAASVLLPYRVDAAAAEDLLLSGRAVGADEALPWASCTRSPRTRRRRRSPGSTRTCAQERGRRPPRADRGARGALDAVRRGLADLERLYLEDLMNTQDANEGLAAFLARRPPVWEHR